MTTSGPGGETAGAWIAELRALILAGKFVEAEALIAQNSTDGPPPEPLELALRQRWGMTLLERGELVAAEGQLRAAAVLAPQDAEAQADLAFVQLRCGRAVEAIATLQRVLVLDPGHRGALSNLGAALMAVNNFAAAEEIYRRLLAVDPGNAAAMRNLGAVLNLLQRHDEALAHADAALAAGQNPAASSTRAASLLGLERFEEAVETCRRSIAAGGDPYEALTMMGQALASLGRLDEAFAAFDQAVPLRPSDHLARYQRSVVRLKAGDFRGGWQDYEARWRDAGFRLNAAGAAARALAGSFRLDVQVRDLVGRRVLVVDEQGVGDEIMFSSMLPDLAHVAAEVTCLCEPRLVRLFAASMPEVRVRAWNGSAAEADGYGVVLPAGSLGRLFRNRPEDFPGAAFLRPGAQVVERWAARLGPRPADVMRIGLSWRGGTARTKLGRRSMPLDELVTALAAPGREFVSLQYGDPRADVAAANARLGSNVRVFDPHDIDDFEDLAGLVANLDVVVSVQTALVHLAGAIGAPCLTLVPQVAEWRYGARGATMPWYGSVRLYRRAGDSWEPTLRDVAAALAQWPPRA